MTTLMAMTAACAIASGCAAPTDAGTTEDVEGTSSAQNIFGQTPAITVTNAGSTSALVSGSGFTPSSTAKIYAWYPWSSSWTITSTATTAPYAPPCKPGQRCGVMFTGGTFAATAGYCGRSGAATFWGYDPASDSWAGPVSVNISTCIQ